jgi:hypothetical protein
MIDTIDLKDIDELYEKLESFFEVQPLLLPLKEPLLGTLASLYHLNPLGCTPEQAPFCKFMKEYILNVFFTSFENLTYELITVGKIITYLQSQNKDLSSVTLEVDKSIDAIKVSSQPSVN